LALVTLLGSLWIIIYYFFVWAYATRNGADDADKELIETQYEKYRVLDDVVQLLIVLLVWRKWMFPYVDMPDSVFMLNLGTAIIKAMVRCCSNFLRYSSATSQDVVLYEEFTEENVLGHGEVSATDDDAPEAPDNTEARVEGDRKMICGLVMICVVSLSLPGLFREFSIQVPHFSSEQCKYSCVEGEHLDRGRCKVNPCGCEHGSVASYCNYLDPGKPWATNCSSCDTGFHLSGVKCVPNICQCEHGLQRKGKYCRQHDQVNCSSCNDGFHLNPQKWGCEENICVCMNGMSAVRGTCLRDGQHKCIACDKDYHLTDGLCEKNRCRCNNGVPKTTCHVHHQEVCQKCRFGFHLADGLCEKNICWCNYGRPKKENCDGNHREECATCNSGFHLLNGKCVSNTCVCDNGMGAKENSCHQDGSQVCTSCDSGYKLSEGKCEPQSCFLFWCSRVGHSDHFSRAV